ncbi:MAG: GSCFA domain-containing protein [Bacteroidota bacterium]|nr:GSCFA domain-containing protein [Bacteroidota bacterium]
MELFRTTVPVSASGKKIDYRSKLMLMGSCFSEHIGNKLSGCRFKVDNNPFGVVYNPLSVKRGLERLLNPQPYTADDLFRNGDVWNSFDHHSRFSDVDNAVCLDAINARLGESSVFLKQADFLFITFGTSFVYYLKSTGQVVANCHKVPAQEFERRRLSVNEVVDGYTVLLDALWGVNPNLFVVFTVSPIRHWKDGAHENQLSKAALLLAIDQICQKYPQAAYFPSYEIVMDELRDYRFYEDDMLHPSKAAINYIWKRFKECYMKPKIIVLMREVEQVLQASQHRPFNPDSDAFRKFAKQFYDRSRFLEEQYQIEMDDLIAYFRDRMK